MRPKHLVTLLVLLTLAVPAAPAHAGGIVSICDEAHLLAALAGGGTVTFSCSGTITLTAAITIAADTTIDGSGQTVTISGNHAVRVFIVNSGVRLNLNRLAVADGNAAIGDGGGIFSDGTLTVSNCTFSGNSAADWGGGIFNPLGTVTVSNSTFSGNSAGTYGGGIFNHAGTVTASNSIFAANSANYGGGIYNNGGALIVSNSTFSGNSAGTYGGGISNGVASTLTVSNSTFSGNNGGGISNNFRGGRVTLKNTIVANSPAYRNCSGIITDGGGNLSYPDATCPGINRDPVLGPLQDNGGPTHTMALLSGSAAIDAADDAICAAAPVNNLDQRGITRPQGPHCDIGAYEAMPPRAYVPIIIR